MKYKEQAETIVVKLKYSNKAINKGEKGMKKENNIHEPTNDIVKSAKRFLKKVVVALSHTEKEGMEKFQRCGEYNIDLVNFFMEGNDKLKKRVSKYFPNIVKIVQTWKVYDEETWAPIVKGEALDEGDTKHV